MKILAYTTGKRKLFYADAIEEAFGMPIEYLDELPSSTKVGELLVVELDTIPDELIEEIKYTTLKYVYVIEDFTQRNLNRFLPLGGNLCVLKSMGVDDFIEALFGRFHLMEIYKLFHIISRTDMELFRLINRAGNGEKGKLSDILFGSTSENTMDVSLSRLRKKLRDPEIGNDFFRIITKKGRLYLVNQLNNYKIDESLLVE
ncbi:hypothetical protein ACRXCV_13010 [Halobacteriovorax sp. GFR7]|uniref:hypothetical protein n=1 Tax=unclassified Halobacteriovorax TaxID=2639665 RepID=UPI003D980707